MWVENWVGRRYYLNWLGGLWIPYASHNPVDTWTMAPLPVEHPILRGVKPWTFRDEVFSRFFLFVWGGSDFHDNMHNVADYRRYLLNGLVWSAKIEVPAAGVVSPTPPEF